MNNILVFMGAIFFPLFYLFGAERKEVFLFSGILSAIAVTAGLAALLNNLFGPGMTVTQIILSSLVVLICAVMAFGLSYLFTVRIYNKKEY